MRIGAAISSVEPTDPALECGRGGGTRPKVSRDAKETGDLAPHPSSYLTNRVCGLDCAARFRSQLSEIGCCVWDGLAGRSHRECRE